MIKAIEKLLLFAVGLLALFYSQQGRALQQQPPTIEAFLQSVLSHHPKLLELQARGEQRQQALIAAQAAFDIQIEQYTELRTSGYYSGDYFNQRIVNPLGVANAKLKAEYRLANGEFPVYEKQYNTLSGGEVSIGFAMSLLQNNNTDKKRIAIHNARVAVVQWEAERALALNTLVYNSLSVYLDWYESHLNMQIFESLVETTEARGKAIQTRIKAGDLAQITQTEFNVTLMQRKLALQEARQKVAQAQEKLVYYYRDSEFQPMPVKNLNEVPQNIMWPWQSSLVNAATLNMLIYRHPALESLRADIQMARNKLRLATNALLPTLDIEAKLARDIGEGPANLTGTESKVGLQFSIPLGRRQAKAEKTEATLRIQELESVMNTTSDALTRDMAVGLQVLKYGKNISELQKQQAKLTEQLFFQEQRRFKMGDSDLFLLNNREATAISSQLDALNAEIQVKRTLLTIYYQAGLLSAPFSIEQ